MTRTCHEWGTVHDPDVGTDALHSLGGVMTRNRASAKQAGARFEREIADYLRDRLDMPGIDRRPRNGAKDRGDIGGITGLVIECKNTVRADLAGWYTEATRERDNDLAFLGVVVHKRHGKGKPEDQWVTMSVRDLAFMLESIIYRTGALK